MPSPILKATKYTPRSITCPVDDFPGKYLANPASYGPYNFERNQICKSDVEGYNYQHENGDSAPQVCEEHCSAPNVDKFVDGNSQPSLPGGGTCLYVKRLGQANTFQRAYPQ